MKNKIHFLIVGVLCLLLGACQKGVEPAVQVEDDPIAEITVDPPLSAADAALLEAAADTTLDLQKVMLDNGESVKAFLDQYDPAFPKKYGMRLGAEMALTSDQEVQRWVFISRMTMMASFLTQDRLHTYPAGTNPLVEPAQTGLGYSYGSRNYELRQYPPSRATQCRSQKFRGLDCSGMIWVMAKEAGLPPVVPLKAYCVSAITDTAKWNEAFRKSVDFKGLIMRDMGKLQTSEMKTGDIILWSGHVGMVVGKSIFQSNGSDTKPKCELSLSASQGPRSIRLRDENLAAFAKKNGYVVYRPAIKQCDDPVTRATRQLLTGGSTKRWQMTKLVVYDANGQITRTTVAPQLALTALTFAVDGQVEVTNTLCVGTPCTPSLLTESGTYSICGTMIRREEFKGGNASIFSNKTLKNLTATSFSFDYSNLKNQYGYWEEFYTSY